MKIAVVGTGYVGLVTGACFAEMGHTVTCIDKDPDKIAALLRAEIPIFEPGLESLVLDNAHRGRLSFSTDLGASVADQEIVFLAVNTPPSADGSADLGSLFQAAESVAKHLTSPATVAIKSTVPVGTHRKLTAFFEEKCAHKVDVVSNPEFLKEGDAVSDFMKPDRIIVGTTSDSAKDAMLKLYAPFNRTTHRVYIMDPESAEMTKYAANAMLATRISFMNELAGLCEETGADVMQVRLGMGTDPRIGASFLFPGPGYGGSCFPKDVSALVSTGREHGQSMRILQAVEAANAAQKQVLFQKISARFGDLAGKKIAVWGLAFKPKTDDIREAPSLALIEALLDAHATVTAADPKAVHAAQTHFSGRDGLEFVDDAYAAVDNADALVLVTEWNAYRRPDFSQLKSRMHTPIVFDGRNIFEPQTVRDAGFEYFAIGRPAANPGQKN